MSFRQSLNISTSGGLSGEDLIDVLRYLFVIPLISIIILPIVYTFTITISSRTEVFGELRLFPETVTLVPWTTAMNDLGVALGNSFIVASASMVFTLLISLPAAYAISRTEFPGRLFVFYFVTLAMLVPIITNIVPIVSAYYRVGTFNTVYGLVFALYQVPIAIWILRDYFQKLPTDIEEAARVYGCTQVSAFFRVILPLARPALIAVGFLVFLFSWNNFVVVALLTDSGGPRTAVVQLVVDFFGTDQKVNYPLMMAETLLIGLPPFILYVFSRRYLSTALDF